MNEDFIHYTWQFQQFEKSNLTTKEGNTLLISKVGFKNHNAGPDFDNARVIIDGIDWAGKVEMHIKSSDWYRHNHQVDASYENVVLHVVWEHDGEVKRADGSIIPTLELKDLVFPETLNKYKNIVENSSDIACGAHFGHISELTKIAMLDKALAHRLEQKAEGLKEILESTKNDFEELAYRVFARNMGFKLNSDAFLRLAENLPFKIIQKHKGNLLQIEALLFGQAGFLENAADDYTKELQTEYSFLSKKYGLGSSKMQKHEWRFLRTRLGNFPTVRLSQFAAVLDQAPALFSFFIEDAEVEKIAKVLRIQPSEYWQKHYDFGKEASFKLKGMGETSVEIVLINTCVNLLALYSNERDNHLYFEKALKILENLKPEKNNITERWKKLGLEIKTAFDSQAVIEQFNNFCTLKKCLNCAIGSEIMR